MRVSRLLTLPTLRISIRRASFGKCRACEKDDASTGAVSTGGLATLALKVARKKNSSTENIPKSSNERSKQNVD
jgi:hypothetical protein